MPWVKIDEHFYDHPKWFDAPGDSVALWLAAMAWCNRNDSVTGFIPDSKTHGLVNVRSLKRTLIDLVSRDAFHRVPGGYVIHDYEEFQQPEKVREISAKRADAGRKGAANRWAEHHRAAEHGSAPLPPETQATDTTDAIANEMANAIANGWPDTETDTGTENFKSVKPNITSEVPSPDVIEMTAILGRRFSA